MPRRKTVTPSRAPRNEHQRRRDTALAAAGYTKRDIHTQTQRAFSSSAISYSTVTATIDGRFRNEKVIEIFCTLTGTKESEMFPASEQPARQRPATRRNMTARRREQVADPACAGKCKEHRDNIFSEKECRV
jgi:hypothetical protein